MAARGGRAGRLAAGAKTRARKVVGPKAIGRIEKSLDAAELALKDLRSEVGRGNRDLVKSLEATLKDSRKNLRSLNRTVLRDLEKLQKAATQGTSPRKAASSRSASGTKRAAAGTRKPAARTASTGARKTAARKPATTRKAAT